MADKNKDRSPQPTRPPIAPQREPNWIKEGYDPDKGVLPPLKSPSNTSGDSKK
jgi:hypothetical protein